MGGPLVEEVEEEEEEDEEEETELTMEDSQVTALMRRTEELQRATAHIADAAGNVGAVNVFDAQPELMAMLGALIKEKNELESQLLNEQAELEEQLANLQ